MAEKGLDIRRLLREDATEAGEADYDFSARDFPGYVVAGPVHLRWQAVPLGAAARLELALDADVKAECVRCLAGFVQPLHVSRRYDLTPDELVGEYPEYPTLADGVLDLAELAYGEVLMEAPVAPLCRQDCPGLCPRRGARAGACTCEAQEAQLTGADPRWDALRGLLDEGEG